MGKNLNKLACGLLLFATAIVLFACEKDKIDRLNQPEAPEGLPISVQIVNEDTEQPVQGLQVAVQRMVAENEFVNVDSALTDADGNVTFYMPAQNQVRFVLPDTTLYANEWSDLLVQADADNSVSMQLFPKFGEAPISINVISALGNAPVKNAYVAISARAYGEEGYTFLDSARTDESGNANFVVDFPLDIQISLENTPAFSYNAALSTIGKKQGDSIQVKTFPYVEVPVLLTNKADGTPLANNSVEFWVKSETDVEFTLLSNGETDANGQIKVPQVPAPGQLRIVQTDLDYPSGIPLVVEIDELNPSEVNYPIESAFNETTIQDRSDWSIIDVDEDGGDPIENILDGDGQSVWHSRWWSSPPPFPHYFVIDTEMFSAFNGFLFKNRNNRNGAIKKMEVLVSDNSFTWKSVGVYNPLDHSDYQFIHLTEHAQGRYIKVIALEGHNAGNPYVNMSEFGVF